MKSKKETYALKVHIHELILLIYVFFLRINNIYVFLNIKTTPITIKC